MDISRGDSFAAFVDEVAIAEGSEKMTEMDLGESLFETKWWVQHDELEKLFLFMRTMKTTMLNHSN